jgi:hypothetical protein
MRHADTDGSEKTSRDEGGRTAAWSGAFVQTAPLPVRQEADAENEKPASARWLMRVFF